MNDGSPRRRLRILRPLVGLIVVWAAWATVHVVLAAGELQEGQRRATAAQRVASPATLRSGAVVEAFAEAGGPFDAATRRLQHPTLAPARTLPVLGRQLRAMAGLAGAAGEAADAGSRAAAELQRILDAPPTTGRERLQLLARLGSTVKALEGDLADLDLGPSDALVGSLEQARSEVEASLQEAESAMADAGAAIGAVDRLLRGPSRYLLLAANNAEMRAGAGTFLSVGILRAEGGDLELSDLQRVSAITVPDPPPPVEGDLAARWGWTNLNREWRNLGMSPRFDANAALASRMWAASTGEEVDGVISLDVLALAAILEATGPVELDRRSIDAEAAVPFLLNAQYDGLDDDQDQAERRERLGELAGVVVQRVQGGDFDVERLATGLMSSVDRRHLMAWSGDRAVQEGWRAAGASGEIIDRSLMVSVLNRAGNKLDWFLRIDNDVVVREEAEGRLMEVRVRLQNRASGNEPRYVLGPDRRVGVEVDVGEYLGMVAVTMPFGTGLIDVEGGTVSVQGPDGPAEVAAVEVRVPRGETTTLTFRLRLPDSIDRIRVEPSARESPARWTIGDRQFRDHRPHEVDLVPATVRGG